MGRQWSGGKGARRNRCRGAAFSKTRFGLTGVGVLADPKMSPANLGSNARIASAIGGGLLMSIAMLRPVRPHALFAIGGAVLLHRALTGYCPVVARLRHGRRDASIDRASDDSFPASDPPAWTPTSALGSPDSPG